MVKKKLEEEEPMKIGKRRGRPAKPKVEKEKKVKKVKPLKIYYKLPPVPKGHRLATMQEAVQAKKVNYWGVSKVDNKVLEGKEKVNKGDLMVKMAGLRGKLGRLKKEIDNSKTDDERAKLIPEFEAVRQELLKLSDKYKKADMSGGAKSEPKEEPESKPKSKPKSKSEPEKGKTFNDYTLKQLRTIAKMYNEYVLIENIDKATKEEIIEELEKHLYIEDGELKLKDHTFEITKKNKTVKTISKPKETVKTISKPEETVDISVLVREKIKEYEKNKKNKSNVPVGLILFLVENYSELMKADLDVSQAINELIKDLYKHYDKNKVILTINTKLGFLGSDIDDKPQETQQFYKHFSNLVEKKAKKIIKELEEKEKK